MHHAIGIDIGGGSTKIGLVSDQGQIIARTTVVTPADATGDAIVARYVGAVRSLAPQVALTGIGIGYPGPIHPGNLSGGIGNVAGLNDYPLAQTLTDHLHLPARLENDATCAALAEARFGPASRRLLMVTAGTGIGVAMIVDGQAMVTSGGCLGDAGHIIMDGGSSLKCRLGCTGCLEALASSEALDLIAAARAKDATTATLIRAALAGDTASQAIIADAGRWIGRAVASWVHTFAPDTVVIGGGLIAAGDHLLTPLQAEARRCGLPFYMADLRIVAASMGNDAGIIGAAAQMMPALAVT